jgi:hypothetical protein
MEFVAFKEKLERSHQLVVARIESAILSLKRKASNLEELEVTISVLSGFLCKICPVCPSGCILRYSGCRNEITVFAIDSTGNDTLRNSLISCRYSDLGS